MAERIPQSVAKLVVFRAFLASDGSTPATGKTIAITISKNGAAFGNPNAGATNATEISSGFYKFTADTTDTGTVGPLAWRGAQADINDAADIYTVCTDLADLTTLITTVDTVVDAIKLKTDNLPSDPADASVIDGRFNTLDTSIADLPTNAELATSQAAADDATLAAIAALPTAATMADAVWDEAIAGHLTAGSTGAALNSAGSAGDPWGTALPGAYGAGTAGKIIGDNLNATVSSRATQTSVDDLPTNAELATALASADDATLAAIDNLPTNAELATALGTADDATLAAIATLQTSVNDLPTNAELATALGTADDATLAAIADLPTNAELATALAAADDATLAAIATLQTGVDDLPTNAELATALATADDAVLAAIAALENLSAAQVNAEVVDALATDTYAEPTGVPAATASLAAKIGRLHQALRNKVTVTATKKQFFDDANAALWEKDLSDDATTYTETEGNAP